MSRLPPWLYRAIVSLPDSMTERDRPLQERIVFFEAKGHESAARDLERLLAIAWQIDTTEWCERGFIYNVVSCREKLSEAFGDEATGDLRLFETGCGGDLCGVGPDHIHYARPADCDLFCTPRVAEQLRQALLRIEAMCAAQASREPRRFPVPVDQRARRRIGNLCIPEERLPAALLAKETIGRAKK